MMIGKKLLFAILLILLAGCSIMDILSPASSPPRYPVVKLGEDIPEITFSSNRSSEYTYMAITRDGSQMVFLKLPCYETLDTFTWSPDGTRFITPAGCNKVNSLTIFNPDQTYIQIARGEEPAWSPFGNKIVFLNSQSCIQVYNIETGELITIFEGLEEPTRLSWSYDENLIAFEMSQKKSGTAIYLMDSLGGDVRYLTNGWSASFSPVRNEMVFSRNGKLIILDLVSGEERDLCEGDWASWSPDGDKLVFMKKRDDKGKIYTNDLYIINRDGSGLIQLTDDRYQEIRPVWRKR